LFFTKSVDGRGEARQGSKGYMILVTMMVIIIIAFVPAGVSATPPPSFGPACRVGRWPGLSCVLARLLLRRLRPRACHCICLINRVASLPLCLINGVSVYVCCVSSIVSVSMCVVSHQ